MMVKTEEIELISRQDLAKLTGIAKGKIYLVSSEQHYHFPEPVMKGKRKLKYYDKAQVLAWLKKNDLKNMPLSRVETRVRAGQDSASSLDNKLARQFLTRTRHGIFQGFSQPCKS